MKLPFALLCVVLLSVAVEAGKKNKKAKDPVVTTCTGECYRKKCPFGFGIDNSAGNCTSKEVCCTEQCPVFGGICLKWTKEMVCPNGYEEVEKSGVDLLCGHKKSVCCRPDDTIYARCSMKPASSEIADNIKGHIHFKQQEGEISEYLVDLVDFSGSGIQFRGFHVHEFGDTTDGCKNAGAHFDPHEHGSPIGDLENLKVKNGKGRLHTHVKSGAALSGENSIIGRSLVLHENADDSSTGAGARVACCVVGYVSGGHWLKAKEDLQTRGVFYTD